MKPCKRQPWLAWSGRGVTTCSITLFLMLAGCSPPAEEASRYLENGMHLLEQEEPAKASLEFRNALQMVSTMSSATYGLALAAEQQEDWPAMLRYLDQVIVAEPEHWQAHLKRGQLYLASNSAALALDSSDAALELAPGNPAVLSLRAGVLYELGRVEEAERAALAALKLEPGHVETLIILANRRLLAGRARDATFFLDQGLKFSPDHIGLTLLKVQALEKDGSISEAQTLLEELATAHPGEDRLSLALARLYIRNGRLAEAEQALGVLADRGPGNLEAKLELVQLVGRVKGSNAATAVLKAFNKAYPGRPELQFALVELLRGIGQDQEADSLLQHMIDEQGSSQAGLQAREILATSHYSQGRQADARALADQVLEIEPRSDQSLFLRATLAVEQHQLEQAIGDLRLLLAENPASDRALLLLAVAYGLTGASELAESQYQRAFSVNPTARYGSAFASHLASKGDLMRAEEVLTRSLQASPENENLLVQLAQVRLDRSNWQGAEAVAQVLQEKGASPTLYDQIRGSIYARRNDYEKSIAAYLRAHEASPGRPGVLRALVQVYVAAGQREAALQLLETRAASASHGINADILLGEVHSSAGNEEKAIRAFEEAIRKDAASSAGYLGLARLHLKAKRLSEAEEAIDAGLSVGGGDEGLSIAKAAILHQKGELDAAIDRYEALLQESPSSDLVANNLASLLSEKDDRASLERAYQLALRFERSIVAHFKDTLGWAAYRLGRHEEAVTLLEDAANREPEVPVFHYHLGMSYLASNDHNGARRSLEKALELSSQTDFPHRGAATDALTKLATASTVTN